MTTETASQTIVIDLFDQAEELDVVGPWEVLASWARRHPDDGWRVLLASPDGRPRTCAKGLTLSPTAALSELTDPADVDVFIEPGGWGSRTRLTDQAHLSYLRALAKSGTIMASVCTGALVYAAAGLLTGRPATTHHLCFDELLALEPQVQARRDERWVDDGNLVTAAGVSAGIDMALHLVGRLVSPKRAQQVQAGLEYFPQPPVWTA